MSWLDSVAVLPERRGAAPFYPLSPGRGSPLSEGTDSALDYSYDPGTSAVRQYTDPSVLWLAQRLGDVIYNTANIPARIMEGSEQLQTMGMDPTQVSEDPHTQTFDPGGVGDFVLTAAGSVPMTAERGAVGVFGGRVGADNLAAQGIHTPRKALEIAQDMAARGKSREEIYAVTSKMMADAGLPYGGVSRDASGKFQFEIPDAGLNVTQGGWTTLGEKVQHPELQKAYPRETRGEALAIKTRPGSPFAGQFDERWENALSGRLNPAQIEANALTPDDLREVLAHEFDHFVGHIEGRAPGANTHIFMQEIEKKAPQMAPEVRDSLAYDMYHRTAGEVSARNAEKRLRMTPEMLQKYPPWMTEDVPPDQQLVIPQGHPYPKDAIRSDIASGVRLTPVGSTHGLGRGFYLTNDKGEQIGQVLVSVVDPKHPTIVNMGGKLSEETGGEIFDLRHELGVPGVRSLLEQFKQYFPEAETIGGIRISGAHPVRTPVTVPIKAERPALGKGAKPLHPEDELSTERLIAPMSPRVREIQSIVEQANKFREGGNKYMADLYQAAARAKAIEHGFEGDPMQWAWPGAKE